MNVSSSIHLLCPLSTCTLSTDSCGSRDHQSTVLSGPSYVDSLSACGQEALDNRTRRADGIGILMEGILMGRDSFIIVCTRGGADVAFESDRVSSYDKYNNN
jgi:hypothetical protein